MTGLSPEQRAFLWDAVEKAKLAGAVERLLAEAKAEGCQVCDEWETQYDLAMERLTRAEAAERALVERVQELHTGAHLCFNPVAPTTGSWYRIGDDCPTISTLTHPEAGTDD